MITVNGEAVELAARTTLDALVPGRRGVAIARNGEVVPRSAWSATELCDGDRIEILEAAPGG